MLSASLGPGSCSSIYLKDKSIMKINPINCHWYVEEARPFALWRVVDITTYDIGCLGLGCFSFLGFGGELFIFFVWVFFSVNVTYEKLS